MPPSAKNYFLSGRSHFRSPGLFFSALALTVGISLRSQLQAPYMGESRGVARTLLQCSVVALGFGMNLHES